MRLLAVVICARLWLCLYCNGLELKLGEPESQQTIEAAITTGHMAITLPFIRLRISISVCYRFRFLSFHCSFSARSALSSVRGRLVGVALLVTRAASLELCALVVLASAESRKTPGGTIGLGEVLRDGLRAKTVLISWR